MNNLNDFHILNKDCIYTLNVSATQELYKIMKEHEKLLEEAINYVNQIENILIKNNIN